MSLYQHLSPDYQEKVLRRWQGVLKAGKGIKNETAALATALVLENTQREFEKSGAGRMLNESFPGGGGISNSSLGAMGASDGSIAAAGGGALGTDHTNPTGVCDSRIPTIVIPTVRRIFPELLAHDTVGVQPMNGPVGFAFALRYQYGHNQSGVAGDQKLGQEMGFNQIDSTFTGADGLTDEDRTGLYCGNTVSACTQSTPATGPLNVDQVSGYWEAFAGAAACDGPYGVGQGPGANGLGADLGTAEWWKIGEDMPMSRFVLEKGVVEAKSRKLAAHWSLELAEDMMNMHGVDVDSEMINVMSYEIQAEIDRQLLGEMVKAAIGANHTSIWSPVSADGRHQLERISSLYTQFLLRAQAIAINTRRGPANFAIADPATTALLERMSDFIQDAAGGTQANNSNVGVGLVGTLRQGAIKLYRDTFAGGNYILQGYKGPTAYDSGIIYCPYIPIQLMRAVGPDDFSPRIGVRTRYGILNHLFGSGNYYQFIKVEGINSQVLEGAAATKVFTF